MRKYIWQQQDLNYRKIYITVMHCIADIGVHLATIQFQPLCCKHPLVVKLPLNYMTEHTFNNQR